MTIDAADANKYDDDDVTKSVTIPLPFSKQNNVNKDKTAQMIGKISLISRITTFTNVVLYSQTFKGFNMHCCQETFSHLQTHFQTSAADNFYKH